MIARLLKGDEVVSQAPLPFAGTTSTYTGRFDDVAAGDYVVQVVAMDPGNANFGWVDRAVTVE